MSAIIASLDRQPELLSIFHLRGLQKSALGALVVKYTGVTHICAVSALGGACL